MSKPSRSVHVIPFGDAMAHDESASCRCKPRVERTSGLPLVIHNAADRREEIERSTGMGFPDRPWLCKEV